MDNPAEIQVSMSTIILFVSKVRAPLDRIFPKLPVSM